MVFHPVRAHLFPSLSNPAVLHWQLATLLLPPHVLHRDGMKVVSFLPPPPLCRHHSAPVATAVTATPTATAAAAGPRPWRRRRRRPATPVPAPAVRRPPTLVRVPGYSTSLSGRLASPPSASAADAAMSPPSVPPAAPARQSGKGSAAAGVPPSSPPPGEGAAASCSSPAPLSPPWVRYRARVAYDGTAFCGWQMQPTGRSVQATLAVALSRRFQSPVQVVGAGRTDAGVHAGGQVCHFDAPQGTDGGRLRHALNRMLPPDVRVGVVEVAPPPRWVVLPPKGSGCPTAAAAVAADVVADDCVAAAAATSDDDDAHGTQARPADGNGTKGSILPAGTRTLLVPWHALSCARGKRYTYRLRFGGVEDPLTSRFRAHEYRQVDIPVLSAALAALVGTHDYSSFANTAASPGGGHTTSAQHNPVRTVAAAVLVAEGSDGGSAIPGAAPPTGGARDFRVDFVLDAALYKMVRNLVGAALAVATGRLSFDSLVRLRDEPRMGANRFVAPARGLTLVRVLYDSPFEDEVEDTSAVELLAAAAAAAKSKAAAAAGGREGTEAADGGGAWGVTAWEGAVAAATAEGAAATVEGAP